MKQQRSATCEQFNLELDRQFEASAPLLSERATQHLGECVACAELYAWISEKCRPEEVSPALVQHIQRSLVSSLAPVPPGPRPMALVLQFGGVFVLAGAAMTALFEPLGLNNMTRWQVAGITAILLACASILSASVARRMIPGSRQWLPETASLAKGGAGLLVGLALLFPWRDTDAFIEHGWPCLMRGLAMSAPVALIMCLLARRGAPLSPLGLGGILGALTGLLGVAALQFRCPNQEASHLLVWHTSVIIVSVSLGLAAGSLAGRFARSRA